MTFTSHFWQLEALQAVQGSSTVASNQFIHIRLYDERFTGSLQPIEARPMLLGIGVSPPERGGFLEAKRQKSGPRTMEALWRCQGQG